MPAISAITLFVDDLTAARDWYARAFGLPEHYADDVSTVFSPNLRRGPARSRCR